MKLKLFKPTDMKTMPWKNGKGTTAEVAISPPSATLDQLNFDWRVSMATVSASGPFSKFPGYRRQLVTWTGGSLLVNGVPREKFEVFEFSGDEDVTTALMTDTVQDFGVIFRSNRVRSELMVHHLIEDANVSVRTDGDSFILCARGEIRVGEFYANPGDVVQVSGDGDVFVRALERSAIVVANLKFI